MKPRICLTPRARQSRGQEAVELAASAGLILDDWQADALERALRIRADGRWASRRVGINVARQNGKGGILEARELAGLFLFGEDLIMHSAHEFATAEEALERMIMILEDDPELWKQVRVIKRSHGQEGVYLKSGQRLRYRTRTAGGGRGWSADCVILDEAMILSEKAHAALIPTLSARSVEGNPQVWYTGSSVDQQIMEHGVVFARVRHGGLSGDPRLTYLEWSADGDLKDLEAVIDDEDAWQQANPALGIRISREFVKDERSAMNARSFAVERLGIGDWPDPDAGLGDGIDPEAWAKLADPESEISGARCYALDVTPNRSHAAIGVSGRRADGLQHGEIVEHQAGTGWVAMRAAVLLREPDAVGIVIDLGSPAASLIPELMNLGLQVRSAKMPAGKLITIGAAEHAQACGILFDAVEQAMFRHLGSAELDAAVKTAKRRPLGDRWAWARTESTGDISRLVAITLAVWGSATIPAADLWVSVA